MAAVDHGVGHHLGVGPGGPGHAEEATPDPAHPEAEPGWDLWLVDLDEVVVGRMSRREKLRALTHLGDLPAAARNYVEAIADAVEVPITLIGTGQGRHEVIDRVEI